MYHTYIMYATLLKASDVAKLLQLSLQGIYALVWKKQIPVVKISRRAIRFDPVALDAWLEAKSSPGSGTAKHESAQEPQPPKKSKKKKSRAGISHDRISSIVDRAKKEVLKK